MRGRWLTNEVLARKLYDLSCLSLGGSFSQYMIRWNPQQAHFIPAVYRRWLAIKHSPDKAAMLCEKRLWTARHDVSRSHRRSWLSVACWVCLSAVDDITTTSHACTIIITTTTMQQFYRRFHCLSASPCMCVFVTIVAVWLRPSASRQRQDVTRQRARVPEGCLQRAQV